MHIIKLQSSDGEIFQVDRDMVKVSVTINNMIDDLEVEQGDGEVIPLPNTKGRILKKVIKWATHHHKDDPQPKETERRFEDMSEWDKDFINEEQSTIIEIMLAAKYLDIKGLLVLACKKMASMINGKTPEEIRARFHIENDFTAEEEEMVRKENDWLSKW